MRLQDPHARSHVSLKLALFVCGTICTRNDLHFDADIAPGARFDDRVDLIDRWRAKVPRDYSPDLSITSLRLDTALPARLRIETDAKVPLVAPDALVDGDNAIVAGHPKITHSTNGTTVITLPIEGIDGTHPNKPLHITLVDGDRSVEAVLPPPQPSGARADQTLIYFKHAKQNMKSAWAMIAVALLGGLILNFMPCVSRFFR